ARLFAKPTPREEGWVYLVAVLDAPFVTLTAFEAAMVRFAEAGFPGDSRFRLRWGDRPVYLLGGPAAQPVAAADPAAGGESGSRSVIVAAGPLSLMLGTRESAGFSLLVVTGRETMRPWWSCGERLGRSPRRQGHCTLRCRWKDRSAQTPG